MDNLKVTAIINMKKSYYDNELYEFSSSEKEDYNKIISNLGQDYGFLDIILKFDDYYRLESLFEKIPDNSNRQMIINTIIKQYINIKILKQINVDTKEIFDVDLNKLEMDLFCGDIKRLMSTKWLMFETVEKLVQKKAIESQNRYARMFFLLDDVYDKQLQKNINDLFAWRGSIAMIGYTTKKLESYTTTNNQLVESTHDYTSYVSSKRLKEVKEEGRRL